MQKSCEAFQNLPPVAGATWNPLAVALQLPAPTGPSSTQLHQQSTILECHAKEQRYKSDMAWLNSFTVQTFQSLQLGLQASKKQ
jgi:hypothetical protein